MTNSPIPKQHPYSSHISKFAMFPSSHPPGDPAPGVRAPFHHPPFSNSDMSVLKKTKGKKATFCDKRGKIRRLWGFWGLSLAGNSYRHELLESPTKTSKSAVIDLGEYGSFPVSKCSYHPWSSKTFVLVTFYSITQQPEGPKQVFHPTPPKTVFPNPKLYDWHSSPSLSERTCNMLRNLERSRWVTSYQQQHTGKAAEGGITNERGRKRYYAASTSSCRLSQSKLICRRVRASRSSKDRWLQWKRDWPR